MVVHFDNFGNIPAIVEIYDILGRKQFERKVLCSQNDYEMVFYLENLPPATYTIRVQTDDFVINRQVVKQ